MSDLLRLLELFKPYRGWILFGILLALASVLANIALMGVSGWFITAMGLAGLSGVAVNYFTPAAIIRACAIVRTGGRYAERLVTHEATFRLITALRVWFYERLEPLVPAILGYERSGDLLSRMRGDIDTLERFYLGFLVPASVTILSFLGIIIAVSIYHPTLVWPLVGTGIFALLVLPWLAFQAGRSCEDALVGDRAEMRAHLAENLQGLGELTLYDTQDHAKETLVSIARRIERNTQKQALIAALLQNALLILSGAALLGAILVAAPLFHSEVLSGPVLAMSILLTFVTIESFAGLPPAFQGLGAVLKSARRIFGITDQKPVIMTPSDPQTLTGAFHLEFENISFAYDAGQKLVFQNLSFELKAGEMLAVTGATGAGKSSLISLLMRFWEPQSGQIRLCGHDINTIAVEDLRRQFSVMEQNPYIFANTIKENLCLGHPDISQEDIDQACQIAGLYNFIQSLPQGYDTYIGEHGKTLSGGQIKRLALARALLKKAPCLILDEPGEGLDYIMEQGILTRIVENLKGRSLILITHRVAGLSSMDHVLHLENGQINKNTMNTGDLL